MNSIEVTAIYPEFLFKITAEENIKMCEPYPDNMPMEMETVKL